MQQSCFYHAYLDLVTQYIYNTIRDLRSFQIRFESAVPIRFDSTVMGRIKNFRIGRVCQLLVVFRRLRPLTALSGTVYRLASSMSDHTPVLFNVFEPLRIGMRNLYISFISFVINYWSLNLIFVEMSYTADSIRDSNSNRYSRFDSYSIRRMQTDDSQAPKYSTLGLVILALPIQYQSFPVTYWPQKEWRNTSGRLWDERT